MAFCKEYNAQTSKMIGDIIPVEITVYEVRDCRASGLSLAKPLAPLLWAGYELLTRLFGLTQSTGPLVHLRPEDLPRLHPPEEGRWCVPEQRHADNRGLWSWV